MTSYRVDVERDGKFWHVRVPAVNRSTQARTLREVEAMARDLIAIMDDVAPGSVGIDMHLALPPEVAAHLRRSAELREVSARAQAEAAAEVRRAAQQLHQDGLTLRDIGQALGVSYQRAHQLVTG